MMLQHIKKKQTAYASKANLHRIEQTTQMALTAAIACSGYGMNNTQYAHDSKT